MLHRISQERTREPVKALKFGLNVHLSEVKLTGYFHSGCLGIGTPLMSKNKSKEKTRALDNLAPIKNNKTWKKEFHTIFCTNINKDQTIFTFKRYLIMNDC